MNRRVYDDFDAFSASVRDVDATMMLNNPVHRSWTIEQATIDDLDFQLGRLGSGNILEGQSWSAGCLFYLPLTPSVPYLANSRAIERNQILILEPGCEFHLSTASPHDWCSIFVPVNRLQALGQTLTGSSAGLDFKNPQCRIIHTNSQVVTQFYSIVSHILQASASATQFETSPGAIAAKDEALRFAGLLLEHGHVRRSTQRGRPRIVREEVLSLCRSVIEGKRGQPIRLGDLTGVTGISERALRTIFKEYFGIGPVRYLQLRRLHELRRRLQSAGSDRSRVTDLMTECGIWEFGLCYQRYRDLFGEYPSQTLRGQ